MYRDFLAMEHYRLHMMEEWPDSPVKRARLAAVRATIASLSATPPAGAAGFECDICHAQHRAKVVRLRPHEFEMPETKAA
jgi:hypothetical protein